MTKYTVYYSGRPCTHKYHKVSSLWCNATFDSFRAAEFYANKWLGRLGPKVFGADEAYDVSCGHSIEIRTEKATFESMNQSVLVDILLKEYTRRASHYTGCGDNNTTDLYGYLGVILRIHSLSKRVIIERLRSAGVSEDRLE